MNRICATEGCETVLSRYNPTDICSACFEAGEGAKRKLKRRRMVATGWTYPEIAGMLGVSTTTAYEWMNPDAAERREEKSRAWKLRNRERRLEYDRRYNSEVRRAA